MEEVNSIKKTNWQSNPHVIEIKREYSIMPPFWSFTERFFSSAEIALEFVEMRKEIERLGQEKSTLKKMDNLNQKEIKEIKKKLDSLSTIKHEYRVVEKALDNKTEENNKLKHDLTQERSNKAKAERTLSHAKQELTTLDRRFKTQQKELELAKKTHSEYESRTTQEIKDLETNLKRLKPKPLDMARCSISLARFEIFPLASNVSLRKVALRLMMLTHLYPTSSCWFEEGIYSTISRT